MDGTIVASEVEFARSFLKQAIGLMFRKSIPESYAMIFEVGREERVDIHTFFVRFPIDLIFLDRDKKVVEVKENMRPWLDMYFPKNKAYYIIELPGGKAGKAGIGLGERLTWD
jgi:uncharacterized membrane protein (UPF0127 family)